uniref:Prolamin-like domain-containing protein n=1 Tax=Timspurckia oligopyrenoides TaxID=708627 RepID=A0A6T6PA47_9RHOD|mmetsp:Transcript_8613/g.15576  ORF Transcript_8613/g.15576 Transcript_8613/m.15576 type:complete len:112 (+) Transcript_8613:281-616(+)
MICNRLCFSVFVTVLLVSVVFGQGPDTSPFPTEAPIDTASAGECASQLSDSIRCFVDSLQFSASDTLDMLRVIGLTCLPQAIGFVGCLGQPETVDCLVGVLDGIQTCIDNA